MKEYTIDRSKWVCGGKKYSKQLGMPQLLNDQGRMCCLGQICKAEGLEDKELFQSNYPDNIGREFVPSWMMEDGIHVTSRTALRMQRVNDDKGLNQPQREKKLKELAATAGVRLKFKGRLMG